MLALLLFACDGSPDEATPAAPTWHADVAPLVADRCAGCHQAGEVGPFPLTTYDEVVAVGSAVAASVAERRMPPWPAASDCADYRDDLSLDDAQIATIVDWVAAGMPEGDPATATETEPPPQGGLSRVDHTLTLPIAYTPTQSPDDYRCFAVDWPETEPTWITGFDVAPDNVGIVHHVVAYLAPPEQVADYAALDAQDAAPGWTCFGGPGVGLQEDAQWLGGWAPGGDDGDFPNGTGIYMEPGSQIVLQMHYNTAAVAAAPDQSAVLVKVDPDVEAPAYIQPWANPVWLYGDSMLIPAGETGVSHSFGYTFDVGDTPFRVHDANLHMHTLGKAARLWIERADGTEECLLDIPRWDFDWQRTYVFTEPKTLHAGDTIKVECTWDNPTDADVAWGEGTGDEMCLGTMLFSE
ncbi:MAG: hypothetical protein ACK4YP_01550 [Myxococcota bacterium]